MLSVRIFGWPVEDTFYWPFFVTVIVVVLIKELLSRFGGKADD